MKINGGRSQCDGGDSGELNLSSGYDELEVNGVEQGCNDYILKRGGKKQI